MIRDELSIQSISQISVNLHYSTLNDLLQTYMITIADILESTKVS